MIGDLSAAHATAAPVPRVSIVMAVYNGADHVERAVRSLLGQTFGDLEVVVVDDGSTDETPRILRGLAAGDARVRLLERPNSGRPAVARNDGLVAARGEYVGFLDHDDFSDPARLATMVHALDTHPHWVAAFHDIALVGPNEESLGDTYLGSCRFTEIAREHLLPLGEGWYECGPGFAIFASLYTPGVHTQSVLIAKNRLKDLAIAFDPQFLICEDTDLWLRLAFRGTLGFLDRALGSYRRHDTSLTTRREAFLQSTVQVHVVNYGRIAPNLDAATRAAYRARIGGYHAALGWFHHQALRMAEARAQYLRAIRWCPDAHNWRLLVRACIPAALIRARRSRGAGR